VSAAAALVWTPNPRLSVRQVVGLLQQTVSGLGKRDDGLGYGVIDVAAAVAQAEALS
jgi:hypothetical protein